MNTICILRILNMFSIVFMIINFLFNLYEYKGNNIFLYIWICAITFGVSLIKDRNQKNRGIQALCFLGLIPALFTQGISNKIYIIILTIISFYIVFNNLFNIDYKGAKYQYNRAVFVIIGSAIFAIFAQSVNLFAKISTIYIIIFFITSVMLLRTLRDIKYIGKSQSKTSTFEIGAVLGVSLILSIDGIRRGIFQVISKIYSSVIDFILKVLGFIFTPLVGPVENFINGIRNYIASLYAKHKVSDVSKVETKNQLIQNNYQESLLFVFRKVLIIILYVIFTVIALYMLYRIFEKVSHKKGKKEEYAEEREFILKENGKNILRKIADKFKLRSNNEKIRYYYKKLLKLYINKGILIQDSDTTKDINVKARKSFDYISLKKIRDIYIGIRYGAIKADSDILEEFTKSYNTIKKS